VPGEPAADPHGSVSAERLRAAQIENNARVWSSGRYLPAYAHLTLQPAEALILARYREALSGRVLDVGCGGGRFLTYLTLLGSDVHGVDLSPRMVEHCRQRFPDVDVRVGDLADLKATVTGPFDSILLTDNVLDVFDDGERRRVLMEIRGLLSPDGLLIFSAHNLAALDRHADGPSPSLGHRLRGIAGEVTSRKVGALISIATRVPTRRANRQRLGPLQHREADHAVVNDDAHDYGLLHYYIARTAQEAQLGELGYTLIDVLEFSGPSVPPGQEGRDGSLYYVAGVKP
jgi:SAM-dependent methyltransferase